MCPTTSCPPARTWRLILGSASPARAQVLTNAGISFTTLVSQVDEDAVLAAAGAGGEQLSCAEQVALLAAAKARAVVDEIITTTPAAARVVGAAGAAGAARAGEQLVVIGCDSLLAADGEIFGKPHDAHRARRRAQQMRGKISTLYTGHHLCELTFDGHHWQLGRQVGDTSCADVVFGHPSDQEIERYVASGEPLEVAGGFTIDGLGGPFIDEIRGDPHGVIGLSLPLLRRLLQRLDKSVTDLWDSHK